ncbi:hypothetical protein Ciccas_014086 [Cichlidogyrus casuarinus]|uniref:Uncharacterized protein n=1 Tax=Cichlidogyrus casuarinus TaxID=1844966 RepID=A0ABD2PIY7_9PLAT
MSAEGRSRLAARNAMEAISSYARFETSDLDSDPEPDQTDLVLNHESDDSEDMDLDDELVIGEEMTSVMQEWVINEVKWTREEPISNIRRPNHNILRQDPEPALRCKARCSTL